MIRLRPADPWLLQAIIFAARNGLGTLKEIIASGDALNHAMFTFAELEGGLRRLLAEGLILEAEGGFVPTVKALEIYDQVEKQNLRCMTNVRHSGRH